MLSLWTDLDDRAQVNGSVVEWISRLYYLFIPLFHYTTFIVRVTKTLRFAHRYLD